MSDNSSDNFNLEDLQILRDPRLAKLLDVSTVTVWRLRQRGILPPKVRISPGISGTPVSAVRALIEKRSVR